LKFFDPGPRPPRFQTRLTPLILWEGGLSKGRDKSQQNHGIELRQSWQWSECRAYRKRTRWLWYSLNILKPMINQWLWVKIVIIWLYYEALSLLKVLGDMVRSPGLLHAGCRPRCKPIIMYRQLAGISS